MKLHRDLGVSQSAAWFMGHRIRGMWDEEADRFAGPAEADETYVGGLEKNKHASKKLRSGRGAVGKAPVLGVKDRDTNRVAVTPVERTDRATVQEFVHSQTEPTATVYTDESASYVGMKRKHEAVRHSVGEYVRQQAHTNGLESFWTVLKRDYTGAYHKMSVKHLHSYTTEFEGRHNRRPMGTTDQMTALVEGADGKRMTYDSLTS